MARSGKPRKSTRLYKELFFHVIDVGLAILRLEKRNDPQSLRLIAANPAARRASGIALEDFEGKLLAQAAPKWFETGVAQACAEVVRSGQAKELGQIQLGDKGIDSAIFAVKAHPLPDNSIVVIFEDIAEHKRTVEALQGYEKLVESAQAQIAVVDSNYRYLLANSAFLKYHGLGREQVVGRSVPEVLGEEVFERNVKKNLDACFRGEAIQYEIRDRFPDLGERELSVSCIPIKGPAGVDRAANVIHDMTERKRAEEALNESEARCRAIFEHAGIGIALVDMEGHPVESNPALQQMLGYSKVELAHMAFTEYTHPDDAQADWNLFTELAEGKRDKYQLDQRFYRKDGEVVWGELTVSLLRTQNGKPKYAIATVEDISQRKQAEEALRQLSGQLLRSQDEAGRRIARELHDTTVQSLAALAVNLGVLKNSAPELTSRARTLLSESLEFAEQCSREVRTLSYLMHPPLLDEAGLSSALRWFIQGYVQRTGIHVDLEMPPQLPRFPGDIELALYRIVQEGLANIGRHSGSKRARICLECRPDQAVLTVADKGGGIPQGVLEGGGQHGAKLGVGIPGMRERIRHLGGQFEILTGSRGTTLRAVVPLKEERA